MKTKSGCKGGGFFKFECIDKSGKIKWVEKSHNLVVNTGLDDLLNKYFKGSAYTAAHYIGLKGAGTVVAGDTMASHAGWSELSIYSQATRPAFTPGTVSGQSVDNSSSVAAFSINVVGPTTVGGGFLSTDSTKAGTAGILYSAVDFPVARSVSSGDTINVTYTFTQADDGA